MANCLQSRWSALQAPRYEAHVHLAACGESKRDRTDDQGTRGTRQPSDDGTLQPHPLAGKTGRDSTLDTQAIAPVLEERRYSFRYSQRNEEQTKEANSLKTNGGPARIRTWDQRIMSPLL